MFESLDTLAAKLTIPVSSRAFCLIKCLMILVGRMKSKIRKCIEIGDLGISLVCSRNRLFPFGVKQSKSEYRKYRKKFSHDEMVAKELLHLM